MCTISLSKILSQSPDLPEAGSMFYDQIIKAFESSQNIIVDMENVTALPSIFLNVSIGRIIDEFGISKLKAGVSFTKITKSQAIRLQDYLKKFNS